MLTILHTEASTGWGGQEIRVLLEAEYLTKRGHRVLIAGPPGSGIVSRARAAGLPVWALPWRRLWDLETLQGLWRLLRAERVDVLNTHSSRDAWLGGLVGRLARVPIIRTRHLSVPIRRNVLEQLVYTWLCDRIITTAEAIRRLILEGTGVPEGKVVVIPTGVELDRFDRRRVDGSRVRRELGIGSHVPVVGMVAVLRSWKGHPTLLEAMGDVWRRRPEVAVVLAGEGPFRSGVEEAVRDFGPGRHVHILGHREDVPDVLAALDVLVQPSWGGEGVPQTVLQALALERPVVASAVGGIPEVILDGLTGLLVPPQDPAALGAAILRVLDDPQAAAARAREGRLLVEKDLTVEAMVGRLERLYEELLDGRHSRPEGGGIGAKRNRVPEGGSAR